MLKQSKYKKKPFDRERVAFIELLIMQILNNTTSWPVCDSFSILILFLLSVHYTFEPIHLVRTMFLLSYLYLINVYILFVCL